MGQYSEEFQRLFILASYYTRVSGIQYGYVIVVNTLRPRHNLRHLADDTLKWILLNENLWISLKIALKFVPGIRINNIPALVQIMAWRWPGDIVWTNAGKFTDAYMSHSASMNLSDN